MQFILVDMRKREREEELVVAEEKAENLQGELYSLCMLKKQVKLEALWHSFLIILVLFLVVAHSVPLLMRCV